MIIPHKSNLCSKYAEKMLSIKINNSCNVNCYFCVDKGGLNAGITDITKIAKNAISFADYKTVIITGGEPFLIFDKVIELLKLLRPHKTRLVLNTNGSLLTRDKIEQLNGLIDELQVSVHSPDEEINAQVFGRKITFDSIKDALIDKKFILSINSTFNDYCKEYDRAYWYGEMLKLCNWLNADRLRLTELKKIDNPIGAHEFGFDKIPSHRLITRGCTEYIQVGKLLVSVKRLCKFAKGKNAQSFSCCFIDVNGQKKIDVDTIDTFKVIYSD